MLLTGLTLGLSQEVKTALPGESFTAIDTTIYMPSVLFVGIVRDLQKLDNLEDLSSTQDSLLSVYSHNLDIQKEQILLLEEKNTILEAKTKRAYLGMLSLLSLFYLSNNK